jgi:putative NADH-flavin reductase
MKIVIFGASGKTGRLLIKQAIASGNDVVAYVRNKDSVIINHPALEVVEGQLNDKNKLKSVIAGSDACISVLGGASLTKHCNEIMEGIDNIVGIMEETGVKRFIYMSSIGAGESRKYMPQPIRFLVADLSLRVPLADHTTNENRIKRSQLEWTIIRPGGLTDGDKTDKMKHGFEDMKMKGNQNISRSNVAAFILSQLKEKNYLKKSVWLFESN